MSPDPRPKNIFLSPVNEILRRFAPQLVLPCLILWISANLLFSYSSLSLVLKIWAALLSLAAWFFLLFLPYSSLEKPPEEKHFPIPLWAWALLGATALFLRFFRLTTLSAWPVMDEGIGGYFSILLLEKWDWNFSQGTSQTPRFFAWGQTLLFKIFSPSLFTLWLYPALWSLLSVPASYFATRKFFSPAVAALVAALTAVSFWPLYLGRYSTQSVFMVFWEWVAFYALAVFLNKRPESKWPAFWLGLATGLGFHTYLSWGLVAFLIALIVAFRPQASLVKRARTFSLFAGTALLAGSPLFISYLNGYRGYFHHLWAVHPQHSWLSNVSLASAYARDLFWGQAPEFFHYGPVWGGFFNPISGAFCFLGLLLILRHWRKALYFWLVFASFFFFIPAVLTNNLEMMRLCQLLPVLTVVTALGIHRLVSNRGWVASVAIALFILAGSAAFDAYHLFAVYANHWKNNPAYYGSHKTIEFYRAYPFLKSMGDRQGPGLILLNFHPDPYDQTLFTATYAFNSAENPALDPAKAKWAAILANAHEQPYLAREFPAGKGLWLSEGLNRPDGGFWLEQVELTPQNRNILDQWRKADQSLKELNYRVIEEGVNPDQGRMLGVLEKARPYFQEDPFLQSRYWRIMALHRLAEGNTSQAIECEKQAVEQGFPMAHLYNELGCLLFKENRVKEAETAFRKALACELNFTDASSNLKNLLLQNGK
jgi:4-amino-4-deoxy-L-arabinose transferase-like glycosyltransferase